MSVAGERNADGRPDAATGGFDDYLRKPVFEEALPGSVGSLLSVQGREALGRELSAKRVRRNVLRLERSEDGQGRGLRAGPRWGPRDGGRERGVRRCTGMHLGTATIRRRGDGSLTTVRRVSTPDVVDCPCALRSSNKYGS